jgi:hypothetical protein
VPSSDKAGRPVTHALRTKENPMTDRRKAMISKIHIARQQLRMADDSYRPRWHVWQMARPAAPPHPAQLDPVLAEFAALCKNRRENMVAGPSRSTAVKP